MEAGVGVAAEVLSAVLSSGRSSTGIDSSIGYSTKFPAASGPADRSTSPCCSRADPVTGHRRMANRSDEILGNGMQPFEDSGSGIRAGSDSWYTWFGNTRVSRTASSPGIPVDYGTQDRGTTTAQRRTACLRRALTNAPSPGTPTGRATLEGGRDVPRLLQAAVSAVTSTREGPVRVQCGQQLPPAPRWPKPAGHPGWVRAALREEPTGVLPSHVEPSVFRHAVRTGRRSAAPRRWQAGLEPQWNPRTRTSALPQQHAGTLNVNIAGSIPRLISLPCPHPSSASDAPAPGIATQVQRRCNAAGTGSD